MTGPLSDAVWAATRKPGFFNNREEVERSSALEAKRILTEAERGRTPQNLAVGRSETVAKNPLGLGQLPVTGSGEPGLARDTPDGGELEADGPEPSEVTETEPDPGGTARRGFPVLDIDEELGRKW